jgi:hypothetical protein
VDEPKTPYETVGSLDIEIPKFFGSKQRGLDKAVTRAKQEAAKLGANGVLVLAQGRKDSGATGLGMGLNSGDFLFSSSGNKETHFFAKLIFLPDAK